MKRHIVAITSLLAALLATPALAQTCPEPPLCRTIFISLSGRTVACVLCGSIASCS
jgi:hypothetical protein